MIERLPTINDDDAAEDIDTTDLPWDAELDFNEAGFSIFERDDEEDFYEGQDGDDLDDSDLI